MIKRELNAICYLFILFLNILTSIDIDRFDHFVMSTWTPFPEPCPENGSLYHSGSGPLAQQKSEFPKEQTQTISYNHIEDLNHFRSQLPKKKSWNPKRLFRETGLFFPSFLTKLTASQSLLVASRQRADALLSAIDAQVDEVMCKEQSPQPCSRDVEFT